MVDYVKEHQLLAEALKFSEEEFTNVCKKVDDQKLFNLLQTLTLARNKILDAMMAHTMERKPTPPQWDAADKSSHVVKAIENELLERMKTNDTSSESKVS